jgi:hypothetical protein
MESDDANRETPRASTAKTLRPGAKAGLVAGGYAAALAAAWLIVSIYQAATRGADRQNYGMMFACGDSILFLAVFGVAAVPATAAALFFLKPRAAFWRVLAVASLAVAATAVAGLVGRFAPGGFDSSSFLRTWSAFGMLRIFVAPLFAIFFLLAGLIAPIRGARISLLVAATVEAAVFACVAVTWLPALRR